MLKKLLIGAALCSFGCRNIATEMVMDPNLSDLQMEAVIKSADYWCDRGEYCLPVSIGEDNGEGYVTSEPKCAPLISGTMDSWTLVIVLCDDRDHLLPQVAPHEMGHALGFDDVKKNGDVMNEYTEEGSGFIELD